MKAILTVDVEAMEKPGFLVSVETDGAGKLVFQLLESNSSLRFGHDRSMTMQCLEGVACQTMCACSPGPPCPKAVLVMCVVTGSGTGQLIPE